MALFLRRRLWQFSSFFSPSQILGVTQETVEAYLQEIIDEGVELAAEVEATQRAEAQAQKYSDTLIDTDDL
ncbi:hypothetical protein HF086_009516 [Spodoptera exigua]|uniref:Uncharacterized protein n=1 Tax=Spodoptera exigua TaxID=7107 RepID=A0A922SEX5_SPOEX|nr:hypothetical protein HF086_009516 [Spodoptera exigua]